MKVPTLTVCALFEPPPRHFNLLTTSSYNFIYLLAPQEAQDSEDQQPARGAPEPPQVIHFLPRDLEVATEHAGDDIHG